MSSLPSHLALPIIDLASLSSFTQSTTSLSDLSSKLSIAFSTTGFAYLINAPLSLTHSEIFTLTHDLFSIPHESKMKVAKKIFQPENSNTYRGYFPAQAGSDNLKEGFEIGPSNPLPQNLDPRASINLGEANVWPPSFSAQAKFETLHQELQTLSAKLLSLLATALGKDPSFFANYLNDSISTLRLLHYPAISPPGAPPQEFCCTPHTDSGILTLLHQDETGGLEIQTPDDRGWITAPHVPGSLVVNVGDLMSAVSRGKFKATRHRVRSSPGQERYSVPFFFEPGAACLVERVMDDDDDEDEGRDRGGVLYGEHVLEKMSGWVEFRNWGKEGAAVVVVAVEESAGEIIAVGA